jgi:hypothetical protein
VSYDLPGLTDFRSAPLLARHAVAQQLTWLGERGATNVRVTEYVLTETGQDVDPAQFTSPDGP